MNRLWQTHLGNVVSLKGINDEHLANIVQFATHYKKFGRTGFLKDLKKEAKDRGLTKAFLDRAPFPYKDGLGNWIVWDFKKDAAKVIGSYLRK